MDESDPNYSNPYEGSNTSTVYTSSGVISSGGVTFEEADLTGGSASTTFSISFQPDLVVDVGGPSTGLAGDVYNQLSDGQTVSVEDGGGLVASCTTDAGADYLGNILAAGSAAFCGVQVPSGIYAVYIPDQWTQSDPNSTNPYTGSETSTVYTSGADITSGGFATEPADVAGSTTTTTFSTSFQPDLVVDVGGPSSGVGGNVYNEEADGLVVTVQPTGSGSFTCTTDSGVDYLGQRHESRQRGMVRSAGSRRELHGDHPGPMGVERSK